MAALEAQAAALRQRLSQAASDFEGWLELAGTLHQLDYTAPNGGKRVPEAADAYRRAAALAPAAQPAARAYVQSNLGALLLGGGRVAEAVGVMSDTLALTRQLGLERTELVG